MTPDLNEFSIWREPLDATVVRVKNEHRSLWTYCYSQGPVEVSRAVAGLSPCADEAAVRAEDLDSIVPEVCDVDQAFGVSRHSARVSEFPGRVSLTTPHCAHLT